MHEGHKASACIILHNINAWLIFIIVVAVNFSEPVYTVGEGDSHAEVCVVLTGQTSRNIAVTIIAQSNTASGKTISILYIIFSMSLNVLSMLDEDYINPVTISLTYPKSLDQNQTLCVNITIVDDSVLENEEELTVSIESTDRNVTTGSPSTVIITDNDGLLQIVLFEC